MDKAAVYLTKGGGRHHNNKHQHKHQRWPATYNNKTEYGGGRRKTMTVTMLTMVWPWPKMGQVEEEHTTIEWQWGRWGDGGCCWGWQWWLWLAMMTEDNNRGHNNQPHWWWRWVRRAVLLCLGWRRHEEVMPRDCTLTLLHQPHRRYSKSSVELKLQSFFLAPAWETVQNSSLLCFLDECTGNKLDKRGVSWATTVHDEDNPRSLKLVSLVSLSLRYHYGLSAFEWERLSLLLQNFIGLYGTVHQ